jgi:hypothetical protein
VEIKRYWVAPRALWGDDEHKKSTRSMVPVVKASDYDAMVASRDLWEQRYRATGGILGSESDAVTSGSGGT